MTQNGFEDANLHKWVFFPLHLTTFERALTNTWVFFPLFYGMTLIALRDGLMSSDPNDPFCTALSALLGPLAQAMVARGVTIGGAHEAMKRAMVDAVVASDGDAVSDSRISLRTGLHRKDVKRLRGDAPHKDSRKSVSAAALAISYWATSPEFQTEDGSARELPRSGDDTAPGFDNLIRKARIDMAPGTVLQALLDQGVVEESEGGVYRLLTQSFLPQSGSDAQVAAYQATLSSHLQAATQNLLATEGQPRNFDRIVRYSHLSDDSVLRLTREANEKAQALLEEINATAQGMQKHDASGGQRGKFSFGAYVLPTRPKPQDDT
jgi:hypothetical protein